MDDEVRRLVESEWQARLGVSRSDLRGHGVHVVTADLGANAAMSFMFGEKCIVVVPPNELAATVAAVNQLDPHEAFTESFLHTIVGAGARVDGPSWHSYVNADSFKGTSDSSVSSVGRSDDALVHFLGEVDMADVIESGFSVQTSLEDDAVRTTFWALRDQGRIVAAGNMSEWRGLNADVGVLTHAGRRGQGLAGRVVATMVEATLPVAGVIRYRALTANLASLAVARRLGFEHFGQNYRARRLSRWRQPSSERPLDIGPYS